MSTVVTKCSFVQLLQINENIRSIYVKHSNIPKSVKFLNRLGVNTKSKTNPITCSDHQASFALAVIEYEDLYPGVLWGSKGTIFHYYLGIYNGWFPIKDVLLGTYWNIDTAIAKERFQQEFYNIVKKFTHHATTRNDMERGGKNLANIDHVFSSHEAVLTTENIRRYDEDEDLRGSRGIGWSIHHNKGKNIPKPERPNMSVCDHRPRKNPKPKTDSAKKMMKDMNVSQKAIKTVNKTMTLLSENTLQAVARHTNTGLTLEAYNQAIIARMIT